MSDIHALETNLDLKQNLNVYANCKQLDILHLIFNIFDGGVQADLTNYNVRLKAMKADNVPLIQDTQYTINKNVVTITPNEQLTITSGTTKIELQFINKKTGEKKATFNLNLKVIPNVLESERSISTATYTLMDELENKLDKAENFFENIGKAIETNTTLVATTNDANTTNANLNSAISTGNTLKTNLTAVNNIATTNITNLTTQNNNAVNNAGALTTKNVEANANITNLTVENKNAANNISTLTTKNSDAITNKSNLDASISNANTTKTALDSLNTNANETKTALNTSNTTALSTKSVLDTSNTNAAKSKAELDASNTTANTTKANLDLSNSTANTTKTNLETSNTNALTTKADLDKLNTTANATKSELTTINDIATVTKKELTAINTTANAAKTDLTAENVRAEANITSMKSFGDVSALSQNVTNLKTEIENARSGEVDLDTRLDKVSTKLAGNTQSISDLNASKANNTDSTRTTNAKDITGAINELNSIKANKDGTLQSNLNAEMLGGKKVDNLTEYYNMLSKEIFQNPNYLKGYTGSFKTDGTAWGTPNDGAEQYYQITYIPNGVTKNGYGTQVLNCYFGANVGRTFQRFSNGTTWGEWNGLLKTYNRQGVSTDMNNVVEPGVYHIQLEYLTANFPIKQWATVYVSYIAHTRWVQQFWIGQTGETFIRYSYDGGSTTIWTPWKRIATTESMDLSLLNGWVPYAQGYDSPRAIKTGNLVALSGLVKSGSGAIAQLPAGWRPPINIVGTSTSADVIARIDVWSDGTIYPTKANNVWVSLNGISFYVS